jgi:hypothetical protein
MIQQQQRPQPVQQAIQQRPELAGTFQEGLEEQSQWYRHMESLVDEQDEIPIDPALLG